MQWATCKSMPRAHQWCRKSYSYAGSSRAPASWDAAGSLVVGLGMNGGPVCAVLCAVC